MSSTPHQDTHPSPVVQSLRAREGARVFLRLLFEKHIEDRVLSNTTLFGVSEIRTPARVFNEEYQRWATFHVLPAVSNLVFSRMLKELVVSKEIEITKTDDIFWYGIKSVVICPGSSRRMDIGFAEIVRQSDLVKSVKEEA